VTGELLPELQFVFGRYAMDRCLSVCLPVCPGLSVTLVYLAKRLDQDVQLRLYTQKFTTKSFILEYYN